MIEEQFKMSVEITGNPKPTAKFYKNGQELYESERIKFSVAENYYLIKIAGTELTDTGTYSVIASNEISQASALWNLTVSAPPILLKTLDKEVIVDEREDIELSIKSDSFPPPTVRWLRDGKPINKGDSRIKIIDDGNNHTLKIHGANRDDTAKYSVELENEHGTITADSQVNVNCAPQLKHRLKNITVSEGDENVELTVTSDGYPDPKIKWYLDGVEITESRNEFIQKQDGEDYKLIIKNVTTDLQGKYSCKLKNSYGEDSSECDITVNCKPRILKPLVDMEVDEGNSLTLNIEVYSVPEPEVIW